MFLTIFTPTFNRGHLLERLFESLKKQSSHNFEWVIIDDGSIDQTKEIVDGFIKSNSAFPIVYFKQENQGKHIAINKGLEIANGRYFFIVDSDDYLTEEAVAIILDNISEVDDVEDSCGLVFHRMYPDGKIVGVCPDEKSLKCSLYDLKFKYGIQGDKAEIFKTSILRQFLFPKIEFEKFCPEALVMYKMSGPFSITYKNKAIYIGDYLDEGLTANIVKIRMKSPYYSTLYYNEQFYFSPKLTNKVKSAINYYRFSFCGKYFLKTFPMFYVLLKPVGYLMHIKDKYNTK